MNFGKKEAYVTVEKKALDTTALVQAVEKLGYHASVKDQPSP